jgi:serine/threonine protein kinase
MILTCLRHNRWVSIKIMTAASTEASTERRAFQYLLEHSKGSLSSNNVVQLLDNFIHQGPNGSHRCLVLELLGPSIRHVLGDFDDEDDNLEPETIIKLSKQLLQSIAFLHRARFAHGGMCHHIVNKNSTL